MAKILSTKHAPKPDKRWEAARNLLVIRADNLGDVLMTTPAIRALKNANRERKITLFTSEAGAKVAPYIPEIDDWIVFNAPWVSLPDTASAMEVQQMVHTLRRMKFDGAVIFSSYSQSSLPAAFLTFLSEIPLRAGYADENPYSLLTEWIPDPEPKVLVRHEVERSLLLAGWLGGTTKDLTLSFQIPDKSRKDIRARLALFARKKPLLILHPGASEPLRRWDIEGYIAVAKNLVDAGKTVLITGSGEEAELADQITKAVPQTVNFANTLTIPELAALLKEADGLITNNTGPAHIAAAVGTPTVVLYARTNIQHIPWGVQAQVLYFDVPCKACDRGICNTKHGKQTLVEPADVIDAVERIFHDNLTRDHHYSYSHFQSV